MELSNNFPEAKKKPRPVIGGKYERKGREAEKVRRAQAFVTPNSCNDLDVHWILHMLEFHTEDWNTTFCNPINSVNIWLIKHHSIY